MNPFLHLEVALTLQLVTPALSRQQGFKISGPSPPLPCQAVTSPAGNQEPGPPPI